MKRNQYSWIYCLMIMGMLASLVSGCIAEQPTQTPTVTITKTHSAVYKFPEATSTVHTVPNPPTRTPTISPTITSTVGVDSATGCPKDRYVSTEEFLAVVGPFNTPRPDEIAKPVFSQERITKLLNTFGAGPFIKYVKENGREHYHFPKTQQVDLTGDGVPELIVRWVFFYIFGCADGKYTLLFSLEPDGYLSAPRIVDIRDGNQNHLPEMIIHMGSMSQGGGTYGIFEYSNGTFVSLVNPEEWYIWHEATGDIRFTDIDKDGIFEVYLYLGIPVWETYSMGIPWRKEWDTYDWDGEYYTLSRRDFSAPEYRFQAAYDGDRSTQYGEYEKALAYYQDVIFSDKLGWWSRDREKYVLEQFWWHSPDPTPVLPEPDPNEYGYLAAYARYRIVVLYLLQGWDSDARIVYDGLQEKYPEGTPGSIYARLATVFWEKYQASGEMGASCSSAVAFALKNKEEVLRYIGINGDVGNNGLYYTPQDICPFE